MAELADACASANVPDGPAAAERVRQYAAGPGPAARALEPFGEDDLTRALTVRRDLLRVALAAFGRLSDLPVAMAVKTHICDVFRTFCETPRTGTDARFRPDLHEEGRALAACARLARFPAGQLDWELSGLPRSYLLKIPWWDWPRVGRMIACGLGGLSPCFFAHTGVRRYRLLFLESESHRAYHRMAQSMALQPDVKGLLMASWFLSPETIRVSPHLSWTTRTPVENGALLTEIGPAAAGDGFLVGSRDRQRLFDAGEYRPTTGLILWPRRALLAWARAHPEFGAEEGTG
jgi:hypothetical protein